MTLTTVWQHARILTALVLLSSAAAQAQDDSSRVELFIEGGPSFSTSRSREFVVDGTPVVSRTSLSTGARLFTGGRLYFGPRDGVEASYGFSSNRLRRKVEALPPGSMPSGFFSDSMRIHQFQFNYVRRFCADCRVQPFGTGGVGLVVYDSVANNSRFTGNFGGGLDIRFHRRVSLRVQVRDVVSELPSFASEQGIIHNVVPSVGFAFKLR